MSELSDLELTKACARAMGIEVFKVELQDGKAIWETHEYYGPEDCQFDTRLYWPLHDDAQAMAMVKKFELTCEFVFMKAGKCGWEVSHFPGDEVIRAESADLCRAICLCTYQLQKGQINE